MSHCCKAPPSCDVLPPLKNKELQPTPRKSGKTADPCKPPKPLLSLFPSEEKSAKLDILPIQSFGIGDERQREDYDSRFCLQILYQILTNEVDRLEELGVDVLTIWSFYLKASPLGVLLSDIDLLSEIVQLLVLNFPQFSYAGEFLELICIQMKLGIRYKSGSELLDKKRLIYAFNNFSQAICTGEPSGQVHVLNALSIWLDQTEQREKPSRLRREIRNACSPILPEYFIACLEQSEFPKAMGSLLKEGAYYEESYTIFLKLLKKMCDVSETIRRDLVKMPLLDPILLKLCLKDEGNQVLARSLDAIFSLIGKNCSGGEKIPSPHEGTFQILLTRLFLQLSAEFSSKNALLLRNDTAFLVCLLCVKIPQLRTNFGRYSQAISSIIATNLFQSFPKDRDFPFVLDSTAEDCDLLTCLIWAVDLVVQSESSLYIISDYALIPALISVLMGPCKLVDYMALSSTSSIPQLHSAAWSALTTFAKKAPSSLFIREGVGAMLDFLNVYGREDSTGVCLRTLSMFTHVIRLVLQAGGEKDARQTLSFFLAPERETMRIFVQCLAKLTALNCSEEEEPILINLLLSCAGLGELGELPEESEFLGVDGVKVLLRLIRQMLYHPANERHMDPLVHIAVAECALQCVADAPSCMEMFLGHEGLLRMLDLLEIGAGPPAKVHLLTCILELIEYPRCMDQLLCWSKQQKEGHQRASFTEGFHSAEDSGWALKLRRGDFVGELKGQEDLSLAALLCSLWREEETDWGVKRDKDGIISCTEAPLKSSFAEAYSREGDPVVKPNHPGPSCVDLVASVRPKIFLLCKKITESLNTEAHLFEGLGIRNQITMQIVINFLDLKLAEVWTDIAGELRDEGWNLVPSDSRTLATLCAIAKNKVSTVVDTQTYLLQRLRENEEIFELEYYKLLKTCHFQDHMRGIQEADYIARTSNYAYLVERRLWQKTELAAAAAKARIPPNSRIHRTTNGPLNITSWPTRTIMLDTEAFEPQPPTAGEEEEEEEDEGEEEREEGEAEGQVEIMEEEHQNDELPSLTSSMMRADIGLDDGHFVLHASMVSQTDSAASPASVASGFYSVPPGTLSKALQHLQSRQKGGGKMEKEDNFWKYRTKWKPDWYPVEDKFSTFRFNGKSYLKF